MSRRQQVSLVILAWVAAFGAALMVDGPLARAIHSGGWDQRYGVIRNTPWSTIARAPGNLLFTLGLTAALCATAKLAWRRGLVILLCAAVTGINWLIKWVVGRERPLESGVMNADRALHPFSGGFWGLLDTSYAGSSQAFPSGDTALAFATAACLARYYPYGRRWFYLGAAVVGLQRVMVNAHYLSDVVAGAGLGVAATAAVFLFLGWRLGVEGADGDGAGRVLFVGDPSVQRAGDGGGAAGAGGEVAAADRQAV